MALSLSFSLSCLLSLSSFLRAHVIPTKGDRPEALSLSLPLSFCAPDPSLCSLCHSLLFFFFFYRARGNKEDDPTPRAHGAPLSPQLHVGVKQLKTGASGSSTYPGESSPPPYATQQWVLLVPPTLSQFSLSLFLASLPCTTHAPHPTPPRRSGTESVGVKFLALWIFLGTPTSLSLSLLV